MFYLSCLIWFAAMAFVFLLIGYGTARKEFYDKIHEEAFYAAKEEYLEFFHNRFDYKAESICSAFNRSLEEENAELYRQIAVLKEELTKEREKNGN